MSIFNGALAHNRTGQNGATLMVATLLAKDDPGPGGQCGLKTSYAWDMRDMTKYQRWADELTALIRQAVGNSFMANGVPLEQPTGAELQQAWEESTQVGDPSDDEEQSQRIFCSRFKERYIRASETIYGIVMRSIDPTDLEYTHLSREFIPSCDGIGLHRYVHSKAGWQKESQQKQLRKELDAIRLSANSSADDLEVAFGKIGVIFPRLEGSADLPDSKLRDKMILHAMDIVP